RQGGQKRDRSEDHHEPLRLNRNDHVEVYDPVRKENAVGQQQAEYGARRADDRYLRMRAHQNRYDRGADAANEKEFRELARSPRGLQFSAEHVKAEHIKENVEEAAVQEDVGEELPQ